MEAQRLRNLTTGRLHTEMGHIYQDLEYITGMDGLFTHMVPNTMRAVEPWLQDKVTAPEYWDGQYDIHHEGDYPLEPMNGIERQEMLERYSKLSGPLTGKLVIPVNI